MLPREIFLSHSSQDREFATSIVDVLRAHGLPVWYAPTNILGAQQWHDEIGKALDRCDWFAIIVSPNAIQSMWVKRELNFALQQTRLVEKIVPILYQPCEPHLLSWTLMSYQMVDFTHLPPSFDDGCARLLRIWGLGYQKPVAKEG
jgi:hypothetical protein